MIHLPQHLPQRVLRRALLELRRIHGRLALRIGAAARTRPLCPDFGGSRGKPIDRFYIEDFLQANAGDLRGRVLEVQDDEYSRRFGGERIVRQDVLHVHSGNPSATIVGDLSLPGVLPAAAFDCIILTQTLQLVFDLPSAVGQIHRALRPGGVLLLTVPGITSIDRYEWKASWYWSFTQTAVERLLCGPFSPGNVSVRTYGNLFSATAFLQGASVQEVSSRKLNILDDAYPVTVAARAVA